MNDIEPFYNWKDLYDSSEDSRSPFYGTKHNEFAYTKRIYNYFIHPYWDEIGSETLYAKLLFADYEDGFCVIELIGEWNDCISNDIMYLKREIVDSLMLSGISKFILLTELVLNFHASDDCYYEEWREDVLEKEGWICFVNLLPHVEEEMRTVQIQSQIFMGKKFNEINWRKLDPYNLMELIQLKINKK